MCASESVCQCEREFGVREREGREGKMGLIAVEVSRLGELVSGFPYS
jgi:hypothetical protein